MAKELRIRVNEKIQAREVRVISADDKQLGILPLREAQERAREKDLDLVEIASQATPPVCRIMDYDKYRYEQSKKGKEAQKKQKGSILKEVWMRTRIGEHDYQVKAKHIKHFLEEGNKVKVIVKFRGREMAHLKLGEQILNRLAEDLVSVSTVEGRIKLEGKSMVMLLAPKRGGAGSKVSDQNKDKDESQEAIVHGP